MAAAALALSVTRPSAGIRLGETGRNVSSTRKNLNSLQQSGVAKCRDNII